MRSLHVYIIPGEGRKTTSEGRSEDEFAKLGEKGREKRAEALVRKNWPSVQCRNSPSGWARHQQSAGRLHPQMMLLLYFIGGLTVFNILPGVITGFGEEFGWRGLMFPLMYRIRPWLFLEIRQRSPGCVCTL